ncbi:hypothetical protein DPMN_089042 [Dreissena polymorpha]|uniref:Uncharacterized protein n=1 Tax=Dreissena polymorpha TaxID=45954 RepID=A0A9D4KW68_DREPO|nr:hypothetical protein DPMN_089042 [Dreissena polymorpha]
MLKLAQTDQQTNQPTNQATDQPTDRAKTKCPHYYNIINEPMKFHDPRLYLLNGVHLTSRQRKTAPPPGGHKTATPPGSHVFKQTRTIFELSREIFETNDLTNLHLDWTINVTSRVLTSNIFLPNKTIFELNRDIIKTNIMTLFYGDLKIKVTSRVFELDQDIIGINLWTKFQDQTKHVASRMLTTTGKQ